MKLEQDSKTHVFTRLALAIGKRARGTGPRFDFAVAEALRRELMEGRFRAAPEGHRPAARRRA